MTRLMTVSLETLCGLFANTPTGQYLRSVIRFAEAMKNVRTMKIEELTKEQILAARRRRSRERCASHCPRCT